MISKHQQLIVFISFTIKQSFRVLRGDLDVFLREDAALLHGGRVLRAFSQRLEINVALDCIFHDRSSLHIVLNISDRWNRE